MNDQRKTDHVLLTPSVDEVDAMIQEIEVAEKAEVADNTSLSDLWSCIASSEDGGWSFGYGKTAAQARANAWVNQWWPERDLDEVPRIVPEGWTFEVLPPGIEFVFRKGPGNDQTGDKGDVEPDTSWASDPYSGGSERAITQGSLKALELIEERAVAARDAAFDNPPTPESRQAEGEYTIWRAAYDTAYRELLVWEDYLASSKRGAGDGSYNS